jgi:hypothetical protein
MAMKTTPINDLSVGMVPRSEFGRRRWFFATPQWYYHRPGPLPALKTDDEFYRLIDPDLRDLCAMLHARGILTAPSCQGHFHDASYFVRVWDDLQSQAELIRSSGLEVQDSETKVHYLFQNRDYDLPWSNFSGFNAALSASQTGGYLGIALREDQRWLWDEFQNTGLRETRARFDLEAPRGDEHWLVHICVDTPSPEEQTQAWQHVTYHLRTLLRTTHPPASTIVEGFHPLGE